MNYVKWLCNCGGVSERARIAELQGESAPRCSSMIGSTAIADASHYHYHGREYGQANNNYHAEGGSKKVASLQ